MRKALVVGINHYMHGGPLFGCVDDAHAVKNVLERHGDGTVNFGVKLMSGTGPAGPVMRLELKKQIQELFAGDSEIALFYFAGHGHIEATGGYLLASDSKSGDDGVPLLDVLTYANKSPARNKITMLQEGEKPKKHKPDEHIFHMDMIGSTKSIAEATLIKIAYELLREEGYEKISVSINSIGDKESMNRFCKELANFYRKNINDLSPHCRQLLKRDPFEVYECTDEKCKGGKEHCPNPISYLTEQSRIHFKEVLEYLETLSIPFEIHNFLVCNRKMWSQTAFALYDEHGSELARGVRYNAVAKKIGFKKDTGAIGITVRYTRPKKSLRKGALVVKQPLMYFIQLGFEAKLKSLIVIEILRKAKVPIAQALNRDKIGVQIQSAETDRIPYTIIMGQKEAMENSVIVREMRTRSQESVPFSQLADYVKKLMESREKGK
jgi:histidyl-tRNA synthetase